MKIDLTRACRVYSKVTRNRRIQNFWFDKLGEVVPVWSVNRCIDRLYRYCCRVLRQPYREYCMTLDRIIPGHGQQVEIVDGRVNIEGAAGALNWQYSAWKDKTGDDEYLQGICRMDPEHLLLLHGNRGSRMPRLYRYHEPSDSFSKDELFIPFKAHCRFASEIEPEGVQVKDGAVYVGIVYTLPLGFKWNTVIRIN